MPRFVDSVVVPVSQHRDDCANEGGLSEENSQENVPDNYRRTTRSDKFRWQTKRIHRNVAPCRKRLRLSLCFQRRTSTMADVWSQTLCWAAGHPLGRFAVVVTTANRKRTDFWLDWCFRLPNLGWAFRGAEHSMPSAALHRTALCGLTVVWLAPSEPAPTRQEPTNRLQMAPVSVALAAVAGQRTPSWFSAEWKHCGFEATRLSPSRLSKTPICSIYIFE